VKGVSALHTLWRRWKAEVRATRSAASFVAEISGRRLPWSEELQTFQWAHEHWIALGAPPDFDRLLQDFFDWSTRAIFASPDPLAAMRVFWEGAPRRGRKKETNAERNFDLALAVQKLVNANAGMSNETACAAVAETAGLSSDEVHKIYYRRQREVRVALAWVALLSEP
jgi:hypothetical protein